MSEWISVECRKPEEYSPVLLFSLSAFGGFYVTSGVLHESHGFFVFNEDGEPETELRSATHWMPLPEPPQDWKSRTLIMKE